MARRWHFAAWVLLALTAIVVALWDGATMSAVTGRGQGWTDASGHESNGPDAQPDELALTDLNEGSGLARGEGDNNLLRPTTTAAPTTSTAAPTAPGGGTESSSSDRDHDPDTTIDTPETTDPAAVGTALTTSVPAAGGWEDIDLAIVYDEDFAAGQVDPDEWRMANGPSPDGWGLNRPSSIAVVPDPTARGGQVLQIASQMGSGDEAGQVITGSLRLRDHGARYGRYSFRTRIESDADQVTTGVVMLWPTDDSWPAGGMIEILDSGPDRGSRAGSESVLHWAEQAQQHSTAAVHGNEGEPSSAADWHLYTLEWQPDQLTISVDDGAPIVLSDAAAQIPQRPMDLAIRIKISPSSDEPDQSPVLNGAVTMFIDWIRIELAEPG